MSLKFDSACRSAIELAKSSLSDDARLDVAPLLDALYHGTHLKQQLPDLSGYFEPPNPRREPPEKVPLSDSLKPLIGSLKTRPKVTAEDLFLVLLKSEPGRKILRTRGMPRDCLAQAEAALARKGTAAGASEGASSSGASGVPAASDASGKPTTGSGTWRSSPERKKAIAALNSFGRMLTDQEPPDRGKGEMQRPLSALVTVLSKMKRHNAIVVGYPGMCGKFQLVISLYDEGVFLQVRSVNYLYCPPDHRALPEVLKAMADVNYQTRLVKFAWDHGDGEIVAYADIWLMDAKLTQEQFHRILGNYVPAIDLQSHRFQRAMKEGRDPGRIDPAALVADLLGGTTLSPEIRAILEEAVKSAPDEEVDEL